VTESGSRHSGGNHRVVQDDVVADGCDAKMNGVDMLLEHALDVGLEVTLGATVHVHHPRAHQVDG